VNEPHGPDAVRAGAVDENRPLRRVAEDLLEDRHLLLRDSAAVDRDVLVLETERFDLGLVLEASFLRRAQVDDRLESRL
jgi:hypothetical protein